MRLLTVLALLLALIALGLAAAAFTGGQAAGATATSELTAAKQRADELEQRLDKLQVQLDAAKAAPTKQPTPATAGASAPVTAAATPAGDATTAPAVSADDAHIKEIVDAELQAQFQKMRAQWGGGGPGGAPALGDAASVKTQLGVTDDQKAEQAAKIVADMRAAIRDLWRAGGDRDANTKKTAELRAEADAKLAEVLTAEELAKAKPLLDQPGGGRRRNQGQGGGGGDNGGQPTEAPAPPKGTSF